MEKPIQKRLHRNKEAAPRLFNTEETRIQTIRRTGGREERSRQGEAETALTVNEAPDPRVR